MYDRLIESECRVSVGADRQPLKVSMNATHVMSTILPLQLVLVNDCRQKYVESWLEAMSTTYAHAMRYIHKENRILIACGSEMKWWKRCSWSI